MDGDVAFRQHAGGHTPVPNWPVFITSLAAISVINVRIALQTQDAWISMDRGRSVSRWT